jgi:WD40 repeat protein
MSSTMQLFTWKVLDRMKTAVFGAVLALIATISTAVARGDQLPEIVWSTNAHIYGVLSITIAADGMTLASGALDGNTKVWALDRQLLREFGDGGRVALSSNGALLAGAGVAVRMWRVADGTLQWKTLASEVNENPVNSIAFSHDGRKLVETRGFSNNGEVLIHDASNGFAVRLDGEDDIPPVYSAAFSPDDSLVASGGADRTAKLWRVSDLSDQPPLRTFIGHSNTVNSVDFSPDGMVLATASADGTARLWNVSNGEVVRIIEGGGGTAKFSADGKLLFTLNNGTFKFWHVSNGALAGSITNTGALVFDVAKNGKYFAYGRAEGAVVLARVPTVLTTAEQRANEFNFEWQGGSGLYQVQQTTSVTSAVWANLGPPSAATNLAVPMTNSTAFFRVQSLSNGP